MSTDLLSAVQKVENYPKVINDEVEAMAIYGRFQQSELGVLCEKFFYKEQEEL